MVELKKLPWEAFFCSFEFTLQNTIYLLKWNRKLCICFAICEIGRMRNMRKV